MNFHFFFFVSAQFKLYPIVQMIRRKSDFDDDDNECNNVYNATEYQNDTNNNNNNGKTITDDADEIDNVSLEILWQPQCGTQITADVVFIHGLHGKMQCSVCMLQLATQYSYVHLHIYYTYHIYIDIIWYKFLQ